MKISLSLSAAQTLVNVHVDLDSDTVGVRLGAVPAASERDAYISAFMELARAVTIAEGYVPPSPLM